MSLITITAIGTGILGSAVGVVLLMPSVMAWDSGNPTLDMKILSYAGLSTIPVSILTTIITTVTQNKLGFCLYLIPILGIVGPLAFNVIKSKFTDNKIVINNTPDNISNLNTL